ncbi:MAG: family transcriptional regulator, anaerobic regulatory protein [Patescibacteria group bacterium]|nr:Crp/Fnr family transcriptional regulator [Candidatus Saccharibacteria bacterium]MDQ5963017.1 family transcriptional regulator, anaerobic regulatory protein [Patescibacteria group bacterium]
MQQTESLKKYTPLFQVSSRRSFSKRRTILFQGEVPRSVHIIESGIVKVYGITNSGDQRTITLLSVGDVFPMSWAHGKSSAAMYYYEAITDCAIYTIDHKEYDRVLSEHSEVLETIYHTYVSHYITATMHIYALEQSHAQDKLNYILQYLVARFGEEQPSGMHKINLRLSHQDIAEMVGITRETTAVELHKFKKKGFIDYQKFTYYVDVQKLVRAMGSDEFQNVSFE